MPWRGPQVRGERPSLGAIAIDWIEENVVIPDGDRMGAPFLLTREQQNFLWKFYELTDTGRRRRYGACFCRPQKSGKDPLAASIVWFEALGPCRFDGWDAAGEPVGKPWATPWQQCAATSEEQAANTWRPILTMAREGPLANLPGIDLGETRVNLPGGGRIEPVTAAARSRLGQRLTFFTATESHLMTPPTGGIKMFAAMSRNAAGMGGSWMQVTNAYDPSEHSVAQSTIEGKAPGVLIDYRPARVHVDFNDDAALLAELEYVYGDSATSAGGWVDMHRIAEEIRDPSVAEADARRFFLNEVVAGASDFIAAPLWAELTADDNLKPKQAVCLGFDGSRSDDHTVIWVSRVSDGRLFRGGWWAPREVDGAWRVPREEVDSTMRALFAAYKVEYLYADPSKWGDYLDVWSAKWPKKVIEFPTNVEGKVDEAIDRFLEACKGRMLTHNGDSVLTQHVLDAVIVNGSRKRDREPGKPEFHRKLAKKRGTVKIDAAVAAVLAYAARGYAIENGAGRVRKSRVVDLGAALERDRESDDGRG